MYIILIKICCNVHLFYKTVRNFTLRDSIKIHLNGIPWAAILFAHSRRFKKVRLDLDLVKKADILILDAISNNTLCVLEEYIIRESS